MTKLLRINQVLAVAHVGLRCGDRKRDRLMRRLHRLMWGWLVANPGKEKMDWRPWRRLDPGFAYHVRVFHSYCFACFACGHTASRPMCEHCALEPDASCLFKDERTDDCLRGLFSSWVDWTDSLHRHDDNPEDNLLTREQKIELITKRAVAIRDSWPAY